MPLLEILGPIGALIGLALAVVWLVFPLYVGARLDSLLKEQRRTNTLLAALAPQPPLAPPPASPAPKPKATPASWEKAVYDQQP
jgi:hypothetical protein